MGFIVSGKNIEGACSHLACRNIHCHTRSFGGAPMAEMEMPFSVTWVEFGHADMGDER